MPSSHAPIKKYNYERSLFRWVMSRHPDPFEKHGITTKILERAPLAREAFFRSDWPGARALVKSNDENKYERTVFFDQIIERGLRDGTKFSMDHVTSEERSKLGIAQDRVSGKYYLHAYGSAKARRNPNRRSSTTSNTSTDMDCEPLHPVTKELGDLLAWEIEAAGEDAEVQLDRSSVERSEPRSAPGCTVLTFSVVIRRRDVGGAEGGVDNSGGDLGMRAGVVEGGGATADAGGGNPSGRPMPQQRQQLRPAEALSRSWFSAGNSGARQQQQQGNKRGSEAGLKATAATLASVAQGGAKKPKPTTEPISISSPSGLASPGVSVGSGSARNGVGGAGEGVVEEHPNARKSVIHGVFTNHAQRTTENRGRSATKIEPVAQLSMHPAMSEGGTDPTFGAMPAIDCSNPSSCRSSPKSNSSNSGNSDSGRASNKPQWQQNVTTFGGGSNISNGKFSFLPGMPSRSSAWPYGTLVRPGAVVAAGWGDYMPSGEYSTLRTSGATGSSEVSTQSQNRGVIDGGRGRVPPSPPLVSWEPPSFMRDDEFVPQQQPYAARGVSDMTSTMGRVVGVGAPGARGVSNANASDGGWSGASGSLPPSSQNFVSGMPTALDHHEPSQPEGGLVSDLEPCTPYTQKQKQQQQQQPRGSGDAIELGGAAVRTFCSGSSSSSSSTVGACDLTSLHDDKELDFLEIFL